MRYIIVGAGAVGGAIGGRLALAGREVVLVARGPHLAALRADALRLVTPDGDHRVDVQAVAGPDELGPLRPDDVLVLTVKSQDTAAALGPWAAAPVQGGGRAADRLPVACAQNGVANEDAALRLFRTVWAVCVWLPATHLEPGLVVAATAPLTGILTLGHHPARPDADPALARFAADLEAARFAAPLVPDPMRWKYGKLLGNLGNALYALVDLAPGEDAELYAEVRAEAEAVLAAAGIAAVGEGERLGVQRDRMKLQEIPGFARGGSSSWQSLTRRTGSIEADYLNGEIALLGRQYGVPTPWNEQLQLLAGVFAREGRAPGTLAAAELRAAVAAAAGTAAR